MINTQAIAEIVGTHGATVAGQVVAETLIWMAEKYGVSIDTVVDALASGTLAVDRFNELIVNAPAAIEKIST